MSAFAEIAATSQRARDQVTEQKPKRPRPEVDSVRALSDADLVSDESCFGAMNSAFQRGTGHGAAI
jgi:hypothetical protein